MIEYKIVKLQDSPKLKNSLSAWFYEKWDIPLEAYLDSMNECLNNFSAVPQWYCAVENDKIVGGLGVIENDFHDRKDLSPNVCAIYVEKDYRCHGIAGEMLRFVCADMKNQGINTLYLVTDHVSFYERYDWSFLCMVQVEGEPNMTRLYLHQMI